MSSLRLQNLLLAGVLLLSASALGAQSITDKAAIQREMRTAQSALQAHDENGARQAFEAILKMDPANAEANANLGVMDFFHGNCQTAESHFRAALRADPGLTKMKALLSVCERQLGQPSAQADMKEAFAQLKDPRLRLRLGLELANLDYQQGHLEQTASVLHSLLDEQPNNVDLLFFAQRVYSELADQTLNKLAVLAPDSARMQQLMAEHLINAGDLKDAITHYEKALQIDPRLPGVHFELAEALIQSSPDSAISQASALQQLHEAIQADGDNANVECELGRIDWLQSKTSEALRHYQKALQLSPDNSEAEKGIAAIMLRSGQDRQAAVYLQKAVKSDPFDAKAHYQLAQVDKKLHLEDEAQKQLKLFLDIQAAQKKVKQLYRQMVPSRAAVPAASHE